MPNSVFKLPYSWLQFTPPYRLDVAASHDTCKTNGWSEALSSSLYH